MSSSPTVGADKRPRARAEEARRNRERLLEVATDAFTAAADTVALEAIARAAGVGIGTLYRHFPTREDLVAAVYEGQMRRLHAAADRLLVEHTPADALREWLPLFADWAATKHGMVDTLRVLMSSGRIRTSQMRTHLVDIVARILEEGAAHGDLRADIPADEVAATFAGVLAVASDRSDREQTIRMLTLVADGLRPGAP